MLWFYTLSICAAVSITGGLAGLIGGWQARQTKGVGTLMHYPPPFIWMRGRLLSEGWVMRLGGMYVFAGVMLAIIAPQLKDAPSVDLLNRPCERLVQTLTLTEWTPARWTQRPVSGHRPGCSAMLLDAEGVRWFNIRSFPDGGMVGEQFRHQTLELERNSMALKPVPGIGDRAMMATPRSKIVANPTLVFADEYGIHSVEMNAQRVEPEAVIKALRTPAEDSM